MKGSSSLYIKTLPHTQQIVRFICFWSHSRIMGHNQIFWNPKYRAKICFFLLLYSSVRVFHLYTSVCFAVDLSRIEKCSAFLSAHTGVSQKT